MNQGTNITFKSNLQVVKGELQKDHHFLSFVHDPVALRILKNNTYSGYRMTSLQEDELEYAIHCSYASEGDYPWGTIEDISGKQKIICRCLNTSCRNFRKCRPEFTEAELEPYKSTEHEQKAIKEAESNRHVQYEPNTFYKKPDENKSPIEIHQNIVNSDPSDGHKKTTQIDNEDKIIDSLGTRNEDKAFEEYVTKHESRLAEKIDFRKFYSAYRTLYEDGATKYEDYLRLNSADMSSLLTYIRKNAHFRHLYRDDILPFVVILSNLSDYKDRKENVDEHAEKNKNHDEDSRFEAFLAEKYGKERAYSILHALKESFSYLRESRKCEGTDLYNLSEQQIRKNLQNLQFATTDSAHADMHGQKRFFAMLGWRLLREYLSINRNRYDCENNTSEGNEKPDDITENRESQSFKKRPFSDVFRDEVGDDRLESYIQSCRLVLQYMKDKGLLTTDEYLQLTEIQVEQVIQNCRNDDRINKVIPPNRINDAVRLLFSYRKYLRYYGENSSVRKPDKTGEEAKALEPDEQIHHEIPSSELIDTNRLPIQKETVPVVTESDNKTSPKEATAQSPKKKYISPSDSTVGNFIFTDRSVEKPFEEYYSVKIGYKEAERELETFSRVYEYLRIHGLTSSDYEDLNNDEIAELKADIHDSSLMNWEYSEDEIEVTQKVFEFLDIYNKKRNALRRDREFGEQAAADKHREQTSKNVNNKKTTVIDEPNERGGFSAFRTVDQEEIIKGAIDCNTVVNAGPGTGKTWTLIEKIIYMINELDIDPDQILVLCFSRAAVEVIKTRLLTAVKEGRLRPNWSRLDIRTFDSFCTYLIAQVQETEPEYLPDYSLESQSYEERIVTATKLINDISDLLIYRHVLVDEVQDLVGNRAKLVLSMLRKLPSPCGFTLLGDYCQSLYDYLATDGEMSSRDFYESIFKGFPDARFCSLNINYRQDESFTEDLNPYRKAILKGTALERAQCVRQIDSSIREINENNKDLDPEIFRQLAAEGSVGILTRTNGQALYVSSLLKNKNVQNSFQHSQQNGLYGDWIARIFQNYGNSSINADQFEENFHKYYPNTRAENYWKALCSIQGDQDFDRIDVEDLLRGIYVNARDPLLYTNVPDRKEPDIVVSNIHRAKGQEFDTVILLDDFLESQEQDDFNDLLENKVSYVALTRPKKHLFKIGLKNQYFHYLKVDGRCYFTKKSFRKKQYLTKIEIKGADDLNYSSFAETEDRQNYIQNKVFPGDEIKFTKNADEQTFRDVPYSLEKVMNAGFVIGAVSKSFGWMMNCTYKQLWKSSENIKSQYFPDVLDEITVDRKITCISPKVKVLPGARAFGDMYIWTGIVMDGLAYNDHFRFS